MRHDRFAFAPFAVLVTASVLAACGGGGGECTTSSDCGDGRVCVSGACYDRSVGCTADRDCPAGLVCSKSECIAKTLCSNDDDCPDGQTCVGSLCQVGEAPPDCTADADCPGSTCNLSTGKCVVVEPACEADADCDDGDDCTLDQCTASECAHAPDPAAGCCAADADCRDVNPCTADTCVDQRCSHVAAEGCCATDADCADTDPCTFDRCLSTHCYHPQQAGVGCGCQSTGDCDDGNPCTMDACLSAACSYSKNPNSPSVECCAPGLATCDDGDATTEDSCDAALFLCQHVLKATCTVDTACNDGNPCTVDRCSQGVCASESAGIPGCCIADAGCDDGNAATSDRCVQNRCEHSECSSNGDCDDANPDTVDLCQDKTCAHLAGCTTDAQCADDDPCTTDGCNEGTYQCENVKQEGCCATLDDCDDANVGTVDDCVAGSCVHTARKACVVKADCSDGFGCTDEVCYQQFCSWSPNLDELACQCTDDASCAPTKNQKDVVCGLYIGSLPNPLHQVCVEVTGTNLGGQSCSWDSQCKSGLCLELTSGKVCYGACLDDLDCFTGTLCGQVSFGSSSSQTFSKPACVPKPTECLSDAGCQATQVCVPGESQTTPFTTVGLCVSVGGVATIGQACASDADCESELCRNLGTTAAPDLRCVGVCASDADCAVGTRCYPDVFYFIYDKETPAVTDDLYDAWPTCFADMGSFQGCTGDNQCPAGEHCELFNNASQTVFAPRCTKNTGSTAAGAACTFDAACKSGYCVDKESGNGFCFGLCQSAFECPGAGSCESVQLTVNDRGDDDAANDILQNMMVCFPAF